MERDFDAIFRGKTILLIHPSGVGRKPIYQRLQDFGARLWCFHFDVVSVFSDVIERWIVPPTGSYQSVDEAKAFILQFLSEEGVRPDAVLTYDEFGVVLASHMQAEFGLPGVPVWMAEACRDKTKFRAACAERGLPSVRFETIPAQMGPSSVSLPFPLVFKPRRGAGSHFVQRADSSAELERTWQLALQTLQTRMLPAYSPWRTGDGSDDFFVEEMVEGPEVDIDCVVQDSHIAYMAISDNFPSDRRPFFMEMGGRMPSRLAAAQQDQIKALVQLLVRTLCSPPQKLSAVLHVEMKCPPAGPIPIELNLRLGGAETRTLNLTAYGVDLGLEAAAVALGGHAPVLQPDAPLSHTASINFVPEHSGVVADLCVPDSVTSDPAFEGHSLYCNIGDTILIPPEGYQYAGWMTVRGEDGETVMSNLQRCVDRCRLSVTAAASGLQKPALSQGTAAPVASTQAA